MKTLIPFILILGLATPAAAHKNQRATYTEFRGVMSDQWYIALGNCETGMNLKHASRSYTGFLGMARTSYRAWSGRPTASKDSARVQVKIADRIAFIGWQSPTRFVWPVGVRGWGCYKNTPKLQAMLCASTHPKVQKWKRNC